MKTLLALRWNLVVSLPGWMGRLRLCDTRDLDPSDPAGPFQPCVPCKLCICSATQDKSVLCSSQFLCKIACYWKNLLQLKKTKLKKHRFFYVALNKFTASWNRIYYIKPKQTSIMNILKSRRCLARVHFKVFLSQPQESNVSTTFSCFDNIHIIFCATGSYLPTDF